MYRKLIILSALLLIVIGTPKLLSAFFINLGMLDLMQMTNANQTRSIANTYSNNAQQNFQLAFKLDDSFQSRWALSRTARQNNNSNLALQILESSISATNRNLPFKRDLILDLINSKEYTQALSLYKTLPQSNNDVRLRDSIAFAYLELGNWREAITVRPDDLYANSRCLTDKLGCSTEQLKHLKHFSLPALNPTYPGLLRYIDLAIGDLLSQKQWSPKDKLYAQMYLQWKSQESEHFYSDSNDSVHEVKNDDLVQHLFKNSLNSKIDRNEIYWYWGRYLGQFDDDALCTGGLDGQESENAVRLMCLWQKNNGLNESYYGEFVSPEIALKVNTEYDFVVRYKTDNAGESQAFVALLEYVGTPRVVYVHIVLPRTNGVWQTWSMPFKVDNSEVPVRAVLRIMGNGAVWFDDIKLNKK